MNKSRIAQLRYEPYILAPYPIFQCIFYLIKEIFLENLFPTPFEREEIKLPDGGTVGLDWDGPIPTEDKPLDKPLLVLAPGLGGGTQNLYTL